MPLDPAIDYEHLGPATEFDETDVNLRSYFCDMSDEQLKTYSPNFTDEELMEWDENFMEDGTLMLVCSERDVHAGEYRAVLKVHLEHRPL
ncbi:MAG: hypothetical protein VCD00_03120 [Candidatus Hydrogenedentota bacterium]